MNAYENSGRFLCPVAVHLVLIEEGRILLMRRRNTGFADGMYCVPAGCIEGGESLRHAMIREAHEEIGITLKAENLVASTVIHRKGDPFNWESIVVFFVPTRYQGVASNCEVDKCDDVRFFPLDALPENLVPYVRAGIANTLGGVPFSEFGWGDGAV